MLYFNCRNNFYLTNFFARYQAWVQYQNLHGSHQAVAAVTHNSTAINVYGANELEAIQQDPNLIVALDLREGLKQVGSLNEQLTRNKHYLLFSCSYGTAPVQFSHTMIHHEFIIAQMIDLHCHSHSAYFSTDRIYNFQTHKPWLFVSFADTARPHRIELANRLCELESKNWVYRLHQQDYGQAANDIDIVDFTKIDSDVAQWFVKSAAHTSMPHMHTLARIPTAMMNRARFNLITETVFHDAWIDTTEKTLRPLMLGMPFVLVSSPGHLARLRNFGFRTYDTVWDESYDSELDHNARLNKILTLLQCLENFDWEKSQQQLHTIGQHNRANWLNFGSYFDLEFRKFEHTLKQLNPNV